MSIVDDPLATSCLNIARCRAGFPEPLSDLLLRELLLVIHAGDVTSPGPLRPDTASVACSTVISNPRAPVTGASGPSRTCPFSLTRVHDTCTYRINVHDTIEHLCRPGRGPFSMTSYGPSAVTSPRRDGHDQRARSPHSHRGTAKCIRDPDHLLDSVDKAVEEARSLSRRPVARRSSTCARSTAAATSRSCSRSTTALPELNIIVATGFHHRQELRGHPDALGQPLHGRPDHGVDHRRRNRRDRHPRLRRADRGAIRRQGGCDQNRHRRTGRSPPFEQKFIEAARRPRARNGRADQHPHSRRARWPTSRRSCSSATASGPGKISIGHIHRNYDIYYHASCAIWAST